jgi:hypothetical protein
MTAGVRIDPASWAAGYASAYERSGTPRMPPGLDGLSWSSGRIEGEADRLAGRPSQLDPPTAEGGPAPGM